MQSLYSFKQLTAISELVRFQTKADRNDVDETVSALMSEDYFPFYRRIHDQERFTSRINEWLFDPPTQ